MRPVLLLLLASSFLTVHANTYYFSSSSGNDSRSFSQAQNSSTPWKSLSKLNSIFSSLRPGDKVLLKKGDTFYGTITVQKSGTAGSPIVIGAYGSGDKPVVTSLVRLTNWVSKGKGIYECYNSNFPSKVNIVLLNGAEQEEGRYPNSNAAGKGYLHYQSYGSNWISDPKFPSSTNWVGADVVIRSRRWIIDRNLITGQSGSRVSFNSASYYKLRDDKEGYFLTNSVKTLDKLGEWYYNPRTKKLSVYFGSNSPSSYSLQVSTNDEVIHCQKFSYIVFDNLSVKGANTSGIYIKFGSNNAITNCNVAFTGRTGVSALYHANFRFENSVITNSNNIGLELGYSGDYATVRNNSILNTALFPHMMANGDGSGIGIHSNGNNALIEYNEVKNTGYIGLVFNGNNTTVKNNVIDGFCTVKDDGAGIYTYTPQNIYPKNRKIIGNIVVNGVGESQGTRWPTLNDVAEGIYLDGNAIGVEIADNTIGNCSNQGLYLHETGGVQIRNNTFYNTRRQISIVEKEAHHAIRNIVASNNIIFSNTTSQRLLFFQANNGHSISSFGRFSGNYYARPKDNQLAKYLDVVRKIESSGRIQSVENPVRFEYNTTKEAKQVRLDATYVDLRNKRYSGSITLQPFTSAVLIKSGAYTNNTPRVAITTPVTNTTYKANAVINISANASDADGTITKVEFYNGSRLLTSRNRAPYTYTWQNVAQGTYTLTAKATDNSGNVTTSDAVRVSVTTTSSSNGNGPTVSLAAPSQNATYRVGETIHVLAKANDPDGSIKTVQLYNGTRLLQTAYWYPYDYVLTNVAPGTYQLIAKATDNSGKVGTSASVTVTVKSSSSSPRVNITNPVNNRTYRAGSTINISANASDDGEIKRVEYYVGSSLVHTEYYAPYSWNWTNVRANKYKITAKAVDDDGKSTVSTPVYITVAYSSRSSDVSDTSAMALSSDSTNASFGITDKPALKTFDFNLFPNPAVNTIRIAFDAAQTNQKAILSIQNVSGSIVKTLPLTLSGSTMDIDISSLNSGVYVLRVTGENFGMSKKFVKIGK